MGSLVNIVEVEDAKLELIDTLTVGTSFRLINTLVLNLILSLVLIHQSDLLVHGVVGYELNVRIRRYRRSVALAGLVLDTRRCRCKHLQVVERVTVVRHTDVTGLELNGMVELEDTAKQRAAGTHLTIYPCRVGQTSLQHGAETDANERYVLLDEPQADAHTEVTRQHGVGRAHTVPTVITHLPATLALGIIAEMLQHEVETVSEGTLGIDDTGIHAEVTFSTCT